MSHTPYIARVLLGRRLVEYRERAGLTVAEACRQTQISETKYRKLERGVNDAVRLTDVLALSVTYQCTSRETTHLRELVEGADSHGWYHGYDVDPAFAHYIEQEGAASSIHIFELDFVNGLFQTEDYLDALRADRPRTRGGADKGLKARRQENTLGSDNPPAIEYVTCEAALRRQVGGPDVMRAQVKHLLEMDERDNINIYVVPFQVGTHPSMAGAYWIMYFADDVFPTTVYLETLHGSHYEETDRIVGHYEEVFPRTRQVAIKIKEYFDDHDELA
jgi:transcriptional regulator with XRE-family HTH domain